MAEGQDDTERSEDPTQKRLDEALERGDVVKSQEVNTWFVIAGGALILMAFSGPMASGITTTLRGLIANSYAIRVDGRGFLSIVEQARPRGRSPRSRSRCCCSCLRPLGGNMIQHRLVWSAEALKPKLSKISPMAGFRRLFSKQALANFVKGLVKLALIGDHHDGAAVARSASGSTRWCASIPPPCCRSRSRCRCRCSAPWWRCSR